MAAATAAPLPASEAAAAAGAPVALSVARAEVALDPVALGRLRMMEAAGAPGLTRTLVEGFLQRAAQRLARLRVLAVTPRRAELAHEAQALAAACTAVGADGLRQECFGLSAAAAHAAPAALLRSVEELHATLQGTREAFTRVLPREQA